MTTDELNAIEELASKVASEQSCDDTKAIDTFIENAFADVPALVAEVRRLRAEIGRAVDTLDRCIPGAAHDPAWNYTLVRNPLASAIQD